MGLDVEEIRMGLDLVLELKLFVARSARRMAATAKEAPAVDACIRSLEEERRGIKVFRHKLPLCVRLLVDVIEVMKEEVRKRREDGDAKARAEDDDKRKWRSTAQLWVDSRGSDADSQIQSLQHTPPPPQQICSTEKEKLQISRHSVPDDTTLSVHETKVRLHSKGQQ